MNTPASASRLTELRTWLADSATRCRAMRWFGALFRISVAEDIAADVAKVEQCAKEAAQSAEQYDHEAVRELNAARQNLEVALSGGLDDSDVSHVRDAIRRLKKAAQNASRSAEQDRTAAQLLTA